MKIRQLLCLLAFVAFIFSSCSKDGDGGDYRDKYEGIYATDVVGLVELEDLNLIVLSRNEHENIVVNKYGVNQLMLLFERGEYVTITVNEDGNFTVPDESFTEPIIDPETGDKLTLNITISITGTITNRMLYIRMVYSGDGLLEVGGVKYPSSLAGTVAYNGTKK